jgi:tripartite-type tricarboxylate transporter receptor subunit TctC
VNFKILKLCFAPALIFVSQLSVHSASLAQESYPSRPIKIIVPVPPGAAADILPRIVAEKLSVRFGQPIVIENRPGANSNIGAQVAAKAPADGYTLLATPPPPLVINQSLYSSLGFEPRAFVPISVLAALTNVLVVNPKLPFSSVPEMVDFAKANPGKLTYASAGLGSGPHLAMEWLSQLAAIRMTHVPYNGLAQALTDVAAGHVDMMFNNTFNVLQFVKDGKLRALGVDNQRRVADLPEVPAISEHFPGYVVTAWFAIVAPPRTPAEIADKLSKAIAEVLREPDIAKRFRDLSAEPIGSTPVATADLIRRERERWHRLIQAAGIKPN